MAMLQSLTVRPLDIPFRVSFKHAAAERDRTGSVWVEARAADGHVGCGEGCPRPYVTGEDLDSAQAFVARHRDALVGSDLRGTPDLVAFMDQHAADVDANPAAWCAVELALLDLLACSDNRSVEAALGLPEIDGTFRYTAVIGDGDTDAFAAAFERYHRLGFTDYKLKLSGNLDRDRTKIEIVKRRATAGLRVRLDANNLWGSPAAASAHLAALEGVGCPLFAIEEPLPAGRHEALAVLAATTDMKIILDESCTGLRHLRQLAPYVEAAPERWIVNLRVSKMGGLIRSLAVVDGARRLGIGIIVGAQVGETSMLTRAALTVASRAGDLLVAQEGAFGTHLLEHDVYDPPLMFGPAGILAWTSHGNPGFGLRRPRATHPQSSRRYE